METKGEKTHAEDRPQFVHKHPEEWERDLNPDFLAGQNIGPLASDRERNLPTAYDRKEVHRHLYEFRDDELRQIPILPEGSRLQQGATYIDLAEVRPREFRAMGGARAERGHYLVPKDAVPYTLWNRLIGEEKPGQEHEGEKDRPAQ